LAELHEEFAKGEHHEHMTHALESLKNHAKQKSSMSHMTDYKLVKECVHKECEKVNMNENAGAIKLRQTKLCEKYVCKFCRGEKPANWTNMFDYKKVHKQIVFELKSNINEEINLEKIIFFIIPKEQVKNTDNTRSASKTIVSNQNSATRSNVSNHNSVTKFNMPNPTSFPKLSDTLSLNSSNKTYINNPTKNQMSDDYDKKQMGGGYDDDDDDESYKNKYMKYKNKYHATKYAKHPKL